MLNGVNLNYIIVLLVTGSVLLAAIYHTILFNYRRTPLLGSYSAYLWATFCYCGFRTLHFLDSGSVYKFFNPDEVLQMIAFAFYIRFAAVALNLHPAEEKSAWRFTQITPFLIGGYIIINTVLVNLEGADTAYLVAKISVRFYLLFMGLLVLIAVIRQRESVFYRYLAAGAASMIACGLISSALNLLTERESFVIGALSWLMFGFFLDVVFFSSAIGYRIRQEHNERESSLKALLQKEAELQQKELEKVKAVYETREEERMRIARDLHDDMGSTLSSIGIYAKVVGSYVETDKEKAGEYLQKIQHNTRLLMDHTNDLIWSLQTNYGESESVYERMQKTAIEMLSSANITPHVTIPKTEELPVLTITAQKAGWLIFKEAITNACKYSKAENCYVLVVKKNDSLVMSIRDDGTGFESPLRGNGLKNMKARAVELDAQFEIKSQPGGGTSVDAVFPLQKISNTLLKS
jgi:signal transduction histidine kinase